MTYMNLKFPPIKQVQRKLPKKLILGMDANSIKKGYGKFKMISTEDFGNKAFAEMRCRKSNTDRDGKSNVPSLYISILASTQKGKGFGSEFIKFAKFYSKKLNCNGNVHLTACSLKDTDPIPQIFYKKQGFETKSFIKNLILDILVKLNKKIYWDIIQPTDMYYPKEKKSIGIMLKNQLIKLKRIEEMDD